MAGLSTSCKGGGAMKIHFVLDITIQIAISIVIALLINFRKQ
jgi:hypothetical protein